mgnify:CR=1 FL=1
MYNNKNKIKEIKLADRVLTLISKDGKFRAGVIKSSNLSKKAQSNHKLPPIPASLLSRMLTGASLMAAFLKGEERIILEATGSQSIKKIFAEAIQVGEVRGFIEYETNHADSSTISDYLGDGLFKVSKILYNKSEPIVGIVKLKKGDISSDLAYYFHKSEQIPTAVILDVSLDSNGLIEHSGGLFVQALPGASEKDIISIHNKLYDSPKITELFYNEMNIEDATRVLIPFDYDVLKNYRVDFFCRCSKEKFISKLLTLGIEEIKSMKNSKHNELICIYCNKHYYLEDSDFDRLINELKAAEN